MSDGPKLKPCPFCASDNVEPVAFDIEDREGIPSRVECYACGAKGPWVYEDRDAEPWSRCIPLWNKRPGVVAFERYAFEEGQASVNDFGEPTQDFDDWQKQREQRK